MEAAVTIKVSSVSFDVENEIVSTHLQGVKQAFVGFDFLDYPPEELESMSSFMNANGKLNFEFERGEYSIKRGIFL